MNRWCSAILASICGSMLVTGAARADDRPPPAAPPPGYAPAVPYGQPVYVQPGYGQPAYGQTAYGEPMLDKREMKRLVRRWEPGDPIPPGFHPEERPRLGLAISGGVILGLFWFGSAVGGAAATDKGLRPLMAPLVGPFIAAGTSRAAHRDELVPVLLVMDGLIQVGSAAMLLTGLLLTRPRLVRDEAKPFVLPAPVRVGDAQGLGVVGRF
ncbi:Hypothetical protein A7982_07370 [Minicystis rosea]|nr:Hypothetical protein A7982_07370 [Minicystis rosea]